MEIEENVLRKYLQCLEPLIGDKRTDWTVKGVIEGIIAGETLRCSHIAAFSPSVSRKPKCI